MIEVFKKWIHESKRIVFFGGAGVSTESGIPDFRSVDGLYNQKYDYPPEIILSHEFFMRRTGEFYRFYRDKMLVTDALPNPLHKKLSAIVTQNIDGLHQKAGSKKVYELHGSIHRNFCMKCGKFHSVDSLRTDEPVPLCDCGGKIKPDVVLYGESLPGDVLDASVRAIENADMLIIGGTSLNVYPAAGLVDLYNGKRLVLINKTPTAKDVIADMIIREPIGELFAGLP